MTNSKSRTPKRIHPLLGQRNIDKTIVSVMMVILVVALLIGTYISLNRSSLNIPDIFNASSQSLISSSEGGNQSNRFVYQIPTGFVEQNVLKINGSVITLGRDCMAIVAATSPERADSIESALLKRMNERPNAHESFSEMLKAFGIKMHAVVLYGFRGDAYLSDAIFSQGEQVLQLDMRPSDAIAIAIRSNAPIYINSTLLNKQGEKIC